MTLAPIVLFVYKRPERTQKTLEALIANPEFKDSDIYVYCDGPKKEDDLINVIKTRNTIKSLHLPNLKLIEQEKNIGLSASIITGVTQACMDYGRAIVIEDDLMVSPHFLHFMNNGLDKYEEDERVMEIGGYLYPLNKPYANDSIFLPFTTTWGWATWQRAWRKFQFNYDGLDILIKDPALKRRFDINGTYPYTKMAYEQFIGKKPRSWGICWYMKVFFQRGLVLYPKYTLVRYKGYDLKGTHSTIIGFIRNLLINPEPKQEFKEEPITDFPNKVSIDESCYLEVQRSIRAFRWGKLSFLKWLK